MLDFSKLFHTSSKDHSKLHLPIPQKDSEWPSEWHTTYYKTYPRFPKLDLPDGAPPADFFSLIRSRQSRRNFTRTPVRREELATFLKYSCGETSALSEGRSRRAQASGGARFPIEVYPIVFRTSGDLPAGLYHYNVKEHKLDVLLEQEFADEEVGNYFTYPWVKDAAIGIVMTAVFWRNQNKYGERGYRYVLIEAGHIGQNMYLASEALGLKCCALGGTRDTNVEELLDIDGETESVVYGLALGK